jgi:hypothetical protein
VVVGGGADLEPGRAQITHFHARSLKSAIKMKLVHNCLFGLAWLGRGEWGLGLWAREQQNHEESPVYQAIYIEITCKKILFTANY